MRALIASIFAAFFMIACRDTPHDPPSPAPLSTPVKSLSYITLKEYPHDTTAYTEGLLIHNNQLYESTGYTAELPQTRSLFGVVDPATGKISPRVTLDTSRYFGEGITFLDNKVYQLTYRTKIGFIYDAKTFKQSGKFVIPGIEGWGMTTDGSSLILSDSSATLWYLDASTLKTKKTLPVTENDVPVFLLNELEYIKGYLYANVYTKDYIVKIDPSNGHVVARLDLTSLAAAARNKYPGAWETNGIAYDSLTDQLYITGKMWPSIYAIRIPF
ncbi:MAG TPA: glutaminyl-peptide cyclotransferase [Puia sp.]|jgi:glutamine cyclotransferase